MKIREWLKSPFALLVLSVRSNLAPKVQYIFNIGWKICEKCIALEKPNFISLYIANQFTFLTSLCDKQTYFHSYVSE